MSESNSNPNSPLSQTNPTRTTSSWPILTVLVIPILAAFLLYQLDSFDPAPIPIPIPDSTHPLLTAPVKNDRVLKVSEFVGVGKMVGPEDIAYDEESGFMYTGCADGWIKRVTVNDSASDSVVEDWVNTGGRPLGLALGHQGEVIVADSFKGLLKISIKGEVELLTDEADGVKFKLTDGVDVAKDGTIYFTDASYKYSFNEFIYDILEARPYGRLMSFDPSTKETHVLVQDLYFANGVAVSPDQDYVVFCETPLSRCRKYYVQGEKKGKIENFIDNLPGTPDNIHYDGHGHFFIGLSTEITFVWNIALRYPLIRKIMAIVTKHIGTIHAEQNAGLFVVDLEGKPVAHYYDLDLKLISSGVKIGNYLYFGSIIYPHIVRLDLAKQPANAKTTATL